MRHERYNTKIFVKHMRAAATKDAREQDFPPEEHTLWMAADRLEDFEDMFDCLNDDGDPTPAGVAAILEKIARQLKFGDREYVFGNGE